MRDVLLSVPRTKWRVMSGEWRVSEWKEWPPPQVFFVSADSKRVASAVFVKADSSHKNRAKVQRSKGVTGVTGICGVGRCRLERGYGDGVFVTWNGVTAEGELAGGREIHRLVRHGGLAPRQERGRQDDYGSTRLTTSTRRIVSCGNAVLVTGTVAMGCRPGRDLP